MKKFAFLFFLVPFVLTAQDGNHKKVVLISSKLVSANQYVIVARGYAKPGLTDKVMIDGTAKEAALLNAQILAGEKFVEGFDVITNGKADKYTIGDGYADVVYILSYPGIKRYLKK
ncbi:MAG TPA: hypothetical protein VF857_06865 [Spirochaetota bacterium]